MLHVVKDGYSWNEWKDRSFQPINTSYIKELTKNLGQKNTVSEIKKKILERLNSRMEMAEKRVSELRDRSIQIILSEEQR